MLTDMLAQFSRDALLLEVNEFFVDNNQYTTTKTCVFFWTAVVPVKEYQPWTLASSLGRRKRTPRRDRRWGMMLRLRTASLSSGERHWHYSHQSRTDFVEKNSRSIEKCWLSTLHRHDIPDALIINKLCFSRPNICGVSNLPTFMSKTAWPPWRSVVCESSKIQRLNLETLHVVKITWKFPRTSEQWAETTSSQTSDQRIPTARSHSMPRKASAST